MERAAMFNWCFIGAGTLANIVAKEILPSGRHRIAAVYTRRAQKCREFAGKYGAAYDSAEAAISAVRCSRRTAAISTSSARRPGRSAAGLTQSLPAPPGATTDVMEILDECRRQMGLVYPFEKAGT